ncbi:hypothetical protein WG906_00070 [Pedobacter sp. P351]|uniref:hypothetical protein n=1 Tax=Pedobacter superstes TaxID=3133441 RepID=UPI0030B1DAEE
MKKILLVLFVFSITTVGIVLASITKKKSQVQKVETIMESSGSGTIKSDVSSWD